MYIVLCVINKRRLKPFHICIVKSSVVSILTYLITWNRHMTMQNITTPPTDTTYYILTYLLTYLYYMS